MLFTATPNSEDGHPLRAQLASNGTYIDRQPFADLNLMALVYSPLRSRLSLAPIRPPRRSSGIDNQA
jgi:hypothetical protein